jgi:hypothetical protein
MDTNDKNVSPSSSTEQPFKTVRLMDDAFSSGEDEPDTFDLRVAAATSRRQLEEHEQTISIDEHHQVDNLPPSAVTPAWSIHAYTGASTSTIDLTLEPNARSPFAQDTFNVDEDVPYTRQSFASPYAPEEAPPTPPTPENSPPNGPVQGATIEEADAVPLQDVPLRNATPVQGHAPAFSDRRESTVSQGPLPSPSEQTPAPPRSPAEIHAHNWPPPESPTSAFDETFKKQMRKSTGPSVLQKVLSKTRPTHLPPKPHEEDAKHQKDWEEMMRLSREAGRRNVLYCERISTETRC